MSFVVLHADRLHTVATDDPLIPAEQVGAMRDAAALLAEVQRLHGGADDDIARARRDAYEIGLAEGREQARTEAATAATETLARFEVASAERAHEQRHDVARLAIEVVRRIAGELATDALVAGLAEQAATAVSLEGGLVVRVAPGLVEPVRQRLRERASLTVEADAALMDTDCVIETPLGRTHAGLDTQLAAIGRAWNLP